MTARKKATTKPKVNVKKEINVNNSSNKPKVVGSKPKERRKSSRTVYRSPLGLDVQLLEQSFKLLEPNGQALVKRFYELLFERYPQVKSLFAGTTTSKQEKKLLTALKLVINNLRSPNELVTILTKLGGKHAGYGAMPEHYAAVASVLLDVLCEFTGDMWTEKVHDAWSVALETIAATMLKAYGDLEDNEMATSRKVMEQKLKGKVEFMDDLDAMKNILEYAPVNIMMADVHENIVFVNKRARDVLSNIEAELATYLPGFKVSEVIGGSIHRYHKNPATIKSLLAQLNPGESRKGEITPGHFIFEHETRVLTNKNGERIGYVVQWHDVTDKRKNEEQAQRLQDAVDGAQSAMMTIDRDLVITYVNESTKKILKENETTLVKIYPGFSAAKIVGTCIDIFHANPAHQRKLLSDPTNLPFETDIKVGELVFHIRASAIHDLNNQYVGNTLEWSDVTELRKRESDVARLQGMIDGAMTPIMMIDRDLNITYINEATRKLLRSHEATLQSVYPGFSVAAIIGQNIDRFHKNPAHQRQLLSDAKNLPYSTDIRVGPLTLNINATAILDAEGHYVGSALEWQDVTQQRAKELEVTRLQSAVDGAQANLMLCDENLNITYVNPSVINMLANRQSELRQHFAGFDAHNLVGKNIDIFHKNPAHQRALLSDMGKLPAKAEIKVAGLEFEVNATAIKNVDGSYMGNMVEWRDITEQKAAERQIQQLIDAAVKGELNERIKSEQFEGFLKGLGEGINALMNAIVFPVRETKRVAEALADGDLTQIMDGDYQGEFAELKDALNTSVEKLLNMVNDIREGSASIASSAGEIAQGNADLSQRTEEQASSLEETASSMEELTSTVNQNADNARQANQLATGARDQAAKGGEVVSNAISAMAEINSSSKKIADIIGVIDEIAFQTNLLALNAAVEAARAGEQGRGFAVVAAEVRNLAQRSAGAAKEIKTLIKDSVEKVEEGTKLVDQSGETLGEIVESIKKVSDIVAEIASASQEQASGIEQINKAITQMDEVVQQNAALVEQAAASSESLDEQASNLDNMMTFFKVGEEVSHKNVRKATNNFKAKQKTSTPVKPARQNVRSKPQEDSEWEEF